MPQQFKLIAAFKLASLALLNFGLSAQAQTYSTERIIALQFSADTSIHSVPYNEILSGGPPKDGIASIDKPIFVSQGEAAQHLAMQEPVIGLEINGDARAYPLRLLTRAEIANDTVGGVPVAVTYCPLCNTAIVFDRRIAGLPAEFGVSGMLRNSDMIMYDRTQENLWQQFTGRPIVGALSATDVKLERYPARLESFENFTKRFPDGKVMSGGERSRFTLANSGRNPYVGYDTSARPFLYRGSMPEGIEPLARVIAVEGVPQAISLAILAEQGTIELGGLRYDWTAGQTSAVDGPQIATSRDVGNVVVRTKGAEGWEDVPYEVTFAFAFHAFSPDGEIVQVLANP